MIFTLVYFCLVQNHTIERVWVKVNSHVNYPIKAVLVDMVEKQEISLDDTAAQYCLSTFIMNVAEAGI